MKANETNGPTSLREAMAAGAVTIQEAADRLGISRSRVQDYIEEGRIEVVFREKVSGQHPRYWLKGEDVDKEAAART